MEEKISAKGGFISRKKIGIDGSRAFLNNKTGIEEYSYRIILELSKIIKKEEVFLYIRNDQEEKILKDKNFLLPKNWKIKKIPMNFFWTQIGLAFEMIANPVDLLFVPAHTIPFIHPEKTIVTIHGLEYEHCPRSYSFLSRKFHQFFIKRSSKWAYKIIAVSNNTKKDLVNLYRINKEKIAVTYNGFDSKNNFTEEDLEEKKDFNWADVKEISLKQKDTEIKKFLLFIGRLEERKNILGIIEVFEILKRKYNYEGKLVLAGKYGYGGGEIRNRIAESEFQKDIVCLGYVRNKQKWELFYNSDIFLFPSFCEGFGIPILEAQNCNIPVITSNYGPMDEIAGDKNILVDPLNYEEMAKKVNKILKEKDFREKIIEKGKENVKKFSWGKSGREVAKILVS